MEVYYICRPTINIAGGLSAMECTGALFLRSMQAIVANRIEAATFAQWKRITNDVSVFAKRIVTERQAVPGSNKYY